jgi:Uncharacterized protein conserved in bacteria (DUF2184)
VNEDETRQLQERLTLLDDRFKDHLAAVTCRRDVVVMPADQTKEPRWGIYLTVSDDELPSILTSTELPTTYARGSKSLLHSKHDVVRLAYEMDVDELTYVGDSELEMVGLLTSPTEPVTVDPLASTDAVFIYRTITKHVLDLCYGSYVKRPTLLVPPILFSNLVTQQHPDELGKESWLTAIVAAVNRDLKLLRLNKSEHGDEFSIQPCKWCSASDASLASGAPSARFRSTTRAVIYDAATAVMRADPPVRTEQTVDGSTLRATYRSRIDGLVMGNPVVYLDGI